MLYPARTTFVYPYSNIYTYTLPRHYDLVQCKAIYLDTPLFI